MESSEIMPHSAVGRLDALGVFFPDEMLAWGQDFLVHFPAVSRIKVALDVAYLV